MKGFNVRFRLRGKNGDFELEASGNPYRYERLDQLMAFLTEMIRPGNTGAFKVMGVEVVGMVIEPNDGNPVPPAVPPAELKSTNLMSLEI